MAQKVAQPIGNPTGSWTTHEAPLSPEVEAELRALEFLNDDVLWAVARSRMTEAKQRRWRRLIEKRHQGKLTEQEEQEMARLAADSDRVTVCKAQAYRLLKERGHRIPELEKLQRRA